MSPRTIFLSKLAGLSCVLTALPMMFHRQAVVEMATGLLRDPKMLFVLGLITLVAGLAMVLAHNLWSGGVLPVVVTVVGWITLLKGLLFLFMFPDTEAGLFLQTLYHNQISYFVCMAICLALGVYMTYGGFASKSRS